MASTCIFAASYISLHLHVHVRFCLISPNKLLHLHIHVHVHVHLNYMYTDEEPYMLITCGCVQGLWPPFWITQSMQRTIGRRRGEMAMCLGQLFSVQQALQLRLVDAVVPQDRLMDAAHEEVERWLRVPCKYTYLRRYSYN